MCFPCSMVHNDNIVICTKCNEAQRKIIFYQEIGSLLDIKQGEEEKESVFIKCKGCGYDIINPKGNCSECREIFCTTCSGLCRGCKRKYCMNCILDEPGGPCGSCKALTCNGCISECKKCNGVYCKLCLYSHGCKLKYNCSRTEWCGGTATIDVQKNPPCEAVPDCPNVAGCLECGNFTMSYGIVVCCDHHSQRGCPGCTRSDTYPLIPGQCGDIRITKLLGSVKRREYCPTCFPRLKALVDSILYTIHPRPPVEIIETILLLASKRLFP